MNSVQSRRSPFAPWRAASALVAAALLAGCGRGPLTPPNVVTTAGTITFQMFVAGSITPAQGDYIIAVNAVTASGSSVNPGESAGMPTVAEAQALSYTHWDQEFVYGFDTTTAPNGFAYSYKVSTSGTAIFIPIILTTNQFIFNPSLSSGTGVNNTMSITLPLSSLSIRSNPSGTNPPTVTTPAAVLLHVNYITLDTAHQPQDQLGCCSLQTSGYDLLVDLTQANTYFNQLTTPPTKSGPPNPNLFITGGQIIVTPAH